MSGAEVASLISAIDGRNDRNDGFFGDGIWGIIMLLIVAGIFTGGWGGFGGLGNRGVGVVANDTLLSDEFIKRDIFNTNQNVSTTGCQTQRDVLESRYTTELGLANLGARQQECCCDTKLEILNNRFANQQCCCETQKEILANRYANEKNTCDIITNNTYNTQRILDKLCENEVNQLRTDLQAAQLQISQLSQTNTLLGQINKTPVPAYLTCSPYMSSFYAYNGFNNNCGCGCGNNII